MPIETEIKNDTAIEVKKGLEFLFRDEIKR
jgi:hypothetical protein